MQIVSVCTTRCEPTLHISAITHGSTLTRQCFHLPSAALCEWLKSRGSWGWPAVRTLEWAPSVPVNREEVGGNVLLNNGALPLATTHLALTLPTHRSAILFLKQVMMWPRGKNWEADAYSRGAIVWSLGWVARKRGLFLEKRKYLHLILI